MVIPSNNDIYVSPDEFSRGTNSLLKLNMFDNMVEELGCIALMKKPYVIGNTGFVGSG